MALRIKWSKRAKYRYQEIIDYLQGNWTDREVTFFIKRTEALLKVVSVYPYAFAASAKSNTRTAVIVKQNSVIYRIKHDHILLLTFWDNRQNPSKNPY